MQSAQTGRVHWPDNGTIRIQFVRCHTDLINPTTQRDKSFGSETLSNWQVSMSRPRGANENKSLVERTLLMAKNKPMAPESPLTVKIRVEHSIASYSQTSNKNLISTLYFYSEK